MDECRRANCIGYSEPFKPESPGMLQVKFKDRNYKGILIFDAFIGAQYALCVCGYAVSVHAGWEEHIIYDTNDFSRSGSGKTTLQGLTLGAVIPF